MIIYSPVDGHPFVHLVQSKARRCFLMTRLGDPVPPEVNDLRKAVIACCDPVEYDVIDAATTITYRVF